MRARDKVVSPFYWTLQEFCEQELMPFVFADGEDERSQYTMLIGQVAARLRRDAQPIGRDGAVTLRGVEARHGGPITTFGKLVGLIEDELTNDETRRDWVPASTSMGSVNAFLRRLRSAERPSRRSFGPTLTTAATAR